MVNVLLIIKKELRTYFNSPIAYIVIVVFLLICGYFYTAPLFILNQATIRHFIDLVPLFYLFFVPAITMRTFAEEYKTGTIEILLTLPSKPHQLLFGKYISAVLFLSIIVGITLVYPISLNLLGKIDMGSVLTSYLSLLMLGCMFTSIGLFASVLTRNQIVAFIVGFAICFLFFIFGKLGMLVPVGIAKLINFLGIDMHFETASRGIIDSRSIIYYLSFVVIFLYSSYTILINKR